MKTSKNKRGSTLKKKDGNAIDRNTPAPNERVTATNLPGVNSRPTKKKTFRGIDPGVSDGAASSSGQEGDDLFEDDIDREIGEQETELTETEQHDLFQTANDMPGDDEQLRQAALDNTDDDGTPLNEEGFRSDVSAGDLDVPGTSLDDSDEAIGEEDEENNEYSIGNRDQDDDLTDE